MTGKKIIAVFGATGAQGGSVARAILKDKNFAVRAVTRDVTRANALALQELGAELAKGDLNEEASVEAVLKGAYGAFVVTSFWDHLSKEKEVQQGKLVADAARRLGLQHVVYSGLENVQRLSGGRLAVPHFDGKGEVEEYFWAIGVPMTSVRVAAYFENFVTMWKPVKAPDGDYYTLALPMGDIPMDGISVADVGAAVSSVFNSPGEFLGKAVGLSAEALTVQQYAEVLSKGLGKEVRDAKISPEAYEKLGFPEAKEIADMCRFYHTRPERDVKLTHRLNPKVKSFSQFISENQGALKGM
ncbi:nmrA-like family domain-containing protein 1 [Dasypus novemcinctus]|uniref:nmrA-like family domain-containing protein 1 n=1 Tax=Dasypus novemcinctus TaxID=9361 RepID=UPI00265D61A0|nr:nmrA-like family domain-containing protein 1 [Dasypus novemcinctus]XP_058157224.1 nmrA-like family domain-containing protein 1 [Dasypus novemcinctus]